MKDITYKRDGTVEYEGSSYSYDQFVKLFPEVKIKKGLFIKRKGSKVEYTNDKGRTLEFKREKPSFYFKYHPDNIIHFADKAVEYADFIAEYPNFPIEEGLYFERRNDEFDLINSDGQHLPIDPSTVQDIIAAINKLNPNNFFKKGR